MIRATRLGITPPGAETPVIVDAAFEIPEGDLCLVIGATGTGKSTLLRAFNGLIPHAVGGRVTGLLNVAGLDPSDLRPRELAEHVGYVAQHPASGFVTDGVEDEIAFGMEQLGLAPSVMRKRVEETLDLMGIADLRRRPLVELSGGQQQRVAIAAVLAAQPRLLLLDEPTSALDPTAAQDVLAALTTLVHEVGLTVVLAEHRLERVMQVADSALWLPGDSRVVAGPAADVLSRLEEGPPLVELARHLGWERTPLSVRDARRRLVTKPGIPDAPLLTEALSWAPHETVATIERLRVRYGEVTAVSDVSLEFGAGEAVTVLGRNGSGKSSLLWAIQGAVPSSGRIDVAGEDPRRVSDARARKLVSLVPQSPADLLYLPTVAAECAQADEESDVSVGTTASLLTGLGVELPMDRNPRDLSEGQRLALVLAIQLAAHPRVICLDEPTRGLDYAMKRRLTRIIKELTDSGIAVVVATHDVEFAATASQRSIVLAEGQVIADGPTRLVCCSSPAVAPQLAKVFHPADVVAVSDLPEGYRG